MDWHGWTEDLRAAGDRCVHLGSLKSEDLEELQAWARGQEQVVVEVDASRVAGDGELMTEVAKALAFPTYFGENWDALDECLRDLHWLPARGYLLLLTNADSLWRRSPQTLLKLMASAAFVSRGWKEDAVPFNLVVVGEQVALAFSELQRAVRVH